MAIWQVTFALIPPGTLPRIGEDGYEIESFKRGIVESVQITLERTFGEPRDLMKGWLVYGGETGGRFDVSYTVEGAEISARADVRDPAQVIEVLCEICNQLSCKVYVPETQEIIVPSFFTLMRCVSSSRAASFVADPGQFLDSIARES